MTIIEQIKAEIERRKGELKQYYNDDLIKFRAYDEMLSILSTIESEKPMNQEGLEEEVKAWHKKHFKSRNAWEDYSGHYLDKNSQLDLARHFAQWGAEHRGSSEIPKDLDEAAEKYQDDHTIQRYAGGRLLAPEFDITVKEVFIAGAKWQANHTPLPEDTVLFNKGVEEGKRLMMEEFEGNRLAACDSQNKEEYERETDFAESIIEKEHRQPTFSDAINYGMRLQKEQMMKEAVEGDIGMTLHDKRADLYVRSKGYLPESLGIKCNDKVRIIIVKEDEK